MRKVYVVVGGCACAIGALTLLGGVVQAQPGPQERPPGAELFQQADKDGDGALTYEEFTAARPGMPQEAFDRMDRNDDGKVTPEEIREGHGGRERMHEILRNADANGDGEVSRAEFDAAKPEGAPADAFDHLDRNGDGVINKDDRPEDRPDRPDRPRDGAGPRGSGGPGGPGFGSPPPGNPRAMLKEADSDGDGKVTLEEFKAHVVQGAEEHFVRLDKNGDGAITKDEIPEHGPGGPGGPHGPGGSGGPRGPRP